MPEAAHFEHWQEAVAVRSPKLLMASSARDPRKLFIGSFRLCAPTMNSTVPSTLEKSLKKNPLNVCDPTFEPLMKMLTTSEVTPLSLSEVSATALTTVHSEEAPILPPVIIINFASVLWYNCCLLSTFAEIG
jgi:hypothetical protein